ncbi:MAG: hypothetical protein ACRDEA_21850 [Microcystaceae cyanobacterium]
MKSPWKKSLLKITLWLTAEILLNFLNLDTLSDYSEFVFEPKIFIAHPQVVLIVAG